MNEAYEIANEQLRLLAIEYRGFSLDLLDKIEPHQCPIILSEFGVWLLDSAAHTLRFDEHREIVAMIRTMHVKRASGETIDSEQWKSLQADSLAAVKLWPAQWLGGEVFPWSPPIARAAMAIALAECQLRKDRGELASMLEIRESQAKQLRDILSKYGAIRCRYE